MRVLATHSIRQASTSLPLLCVTVCHQVPNELYSPGRWLLCPNGSPVSSEMRSRQVAGSKGYRQSVQLCFPLGVVVVLVVKRHYSLLKYHGKFYSFWKVL